MANTRALTALAVLGLSTFALTSNIAFAGDAAAGQAKAAVCGGCHGPDGISFTPEVPNLKGQKETYILKQIGDFKSGLRKNPIMSSMVSGLSDTDAADIAAYFSSLK